MAIPENFFVSVWDYTDITVTIKLNSVLDFDVYLSKKWVFRPKIIEGSGRDHNAAILYIVYRFIEH